MNGPTTQKKELPYDKTDRGSILTYASKLTGHTLSDFEEILADGSPVHTKGYFGQALEKGYFLIDNNSSPLPDFPEAGIELKSTPMKKTRKGLVSKERLVLGIINYMDVTEKGSWDRTFGKKSTDLLIVFYEHEPDAPFCNYKVTKVTEWTFPEEDLRIIREDWDTIEGYILEGRAEELSEGLTNYLAACTKGTGHGKDMREQPFSDKMAKQRALSLKQSYVNKIFEESADLSERLRGETLIDTVTPGDTEHSQNIFEDVWDESTTFEGSVIGKLSQFIGKRCKDIEAAVGEINPDAKSYYAILTRYMLGVKTRDIEEFRNAEICLKTIRLNTKNVSKESMSFPYFDYREIAEQEWDDSDFLEQLDKKFFFAIFRMTDGKNKDKRNAEFLGAFFWTMPYQDMEEARNVWLKAKKAIIEGDYGNLPRESQSYVSHVRPHGCNSSDTNEGPDGNQHVKRCFWLNRMYITKIATDELHLNSHNA